MERRTGFIAIGIAVAVLAVSAYVAYDFNGKSFDFSDRETRIIVTGSMDGNEHPSHWYSCGECGYESLFPECPDHPDAQMAKHDIAVKSAPLHSLVMIKHLDSDGVNSLHVGDVISFDNGRLTIHRIIDIRKDTEGNIIQITTKGDAVSASDSPITVDKVHGIVVGESGWMGQLVHFAQSKTILLVMIIVILFMIFTAVRDIINIRTKKNRSE